MTEYLDLPHGLIHWKDYGGRGRPIVMVHGLGGSIANWDVIGPRLSTHGRVVALDLPGFGLSPPGNDWSLETHISAIIDVVEHVGHPVTLVGNSLGALLCEIIAATHPGSIDALVLISPATPPRFPDPHIYWPNARRLILNATPVIGPAVSRRVLASMTPRELINDSLRRITHKPGNVPPQLVESFVEIAETRSHLPWAADAVPLTGQSIRRFLLKRSRFIGMIRDIKAPTLVIHGIADRIVSRSSVEWLCSLRPDWSLVQLEDTGHTPQIDAPIRTLSVLEPWLEGLREQEIAV
jgi:pimeloyl-ACP methyl ester carboxylesterase